MPRPILRLDANRPHIRGVQGDGDGDRDGCFEASTMEELWNWWKESCGGLQASSGILVVLVYESARV
jgi:hypothetical protein